jgi:hypothetical protein
VWTWNMHILFWNGSKFVNVIFRATFAVYSLLLVTTIFWLSIHGFQGWDLPIFESQPSASIIRLFNVRLPIFYCPANHIITQVQSTKYLVPSSQSSLAFLTYVLGIFSCEIHTILWSNIIVYILNAKSELK